MSRKLNKAKAYLRAHSIRVNLYDPPDAQKVWRKYGWAPKSEQQKSNLIVVRRKEAA